MKRVGNDKQSWQKACDGCAACAKAASCEKQDGPRLTGWPLALAAALAFVLPMAAAVGTATALMVSSGGTVSQDKLAAAVAAALVAGIAVAAILVPRIRPARCEES